MATIIRTNHKPRPVLSWADLTPAEQGEFDHYRGEDDGASYARYRGAVYDLSDMPRAPASLAPWDGALADSAFSAVLARFVDDGDAVVMGLALS